MTGLSDTEYERLAMIVQSPSYMVRVSAYVNHVIGTHEQAATLAERERLLGVIEVLASDWGQSSEWATKRGYPPQDDALTWAQEHHARKVRTLIAQERAR